GARTVEGEAYSTSYINGEEVESVRPVLNQPVPDPAEAPLGILSSSAGEPVTAGEAGETIVFEAGDMRSVTQFFNEAGNQVVELDTPCVIQEGQNVVVAEVEVEHPEGVLLYSCTTLAGPATFYADVTVD